MSATAEARAWARALGFSGATLLATSLQFDGADAVTYSAQTSERDVTVADGGLQSREVLTVLVPKADFPSAPVRGTVITRVSDSVDYVVAQPAPDNNPVFWVCQAYRGPK